MGLDIAGKAELDTELFNAFVKVGASVDKLCDRIAQQMRQEQRRLAALPNYYRFARMSAPGAAVTDIQDFGGPQPGRVWIVRLLIAAASPLAANAAVVTWYVGQVMPGPAAGMLPATNVVWQFPSVPGVQTFTSNTIEVLPGEHLIAGLTGIPASSNIALNVAVNDQPLYAQSSAVAVE